MLAMRKKRTDQRQRRSERISNELLKNSVPTAHSRGPFLTQKMQIGQMKNMLTNTEVVIKLL